jgi:hypothetical protein
MTSWPTKALLASITVVAASTIGLPGVKGYGTVLDQVVTFGSWGMVAALTSPWYANTHLLAIWPVAAILNSILFVGPAILIWLVGHKRRPNASSFATFIWCAFYVSSLFWFFPAPDGP